MTQTSFRGTSTLRKPSVLIFSVPNVDHPLGTDTNTIYKKLMNTLECKLIILQQEALQIDIVIHNPHTLSHGSKIKFQKLTEDKIRAREVDNLKHTFSWLGHLN